MTTTTTVQVWHKGWSQPALFTAAVNDDGHELHAEAMPVFFRGFREYKPGDQMFLAFDFERADDGAGAAAILAEAFERFNVGADEIASKYRSRGNRSLSVGDVVVIGGDAYACASLGWSKLDEFRPVLSAH